MNAHWRRRRRDAVDRRRQPRTDGSLVTAILTLTAGALLTLTAGLWAMTKLEQFGPAVGGIIVIRPDPGATERWSVTAAVADPLHVGLPSESNGRHCVLSPVAMAGRGGSLVIEARRLSTPPLYRVHWAGGHTDAEATDCGRAADLVLERSELMRLANMAGGFKNGLRLIGP